MADKPVDRKLDVLGGTPIFAGTRIPVRILIEQMGFDSTESERARPRLPQDVAGAGSETDSSERETLQLLDGQRETPEHEVKCRQPDCLRNRGTAASFNPA